VKLLNVDPGKATNRTVITFVGEPDKVAQAAFLLIKTAAELIDMSKHKGEHPRMGATDVCPFVPIANMTMDEAVEVARKVGERVGKELGIPGYFTRMQLLKKREETWRIAVRENTKDYLKN
jgi:glutamate formiminotransferase/formiminotetrahydrofolate cyclodeaminase